ncbi:MAG: hypothetical protein AMXMBFR33_45050 [Candidatus Xenobia bacterium]
METRAPFRFTVDTGARAEWTNLRLKGSFNPATGEYDPQWNGGQTIPMRDDGLEGDEVAGDGVYTATVSLKTEPRTYEWGVVADTKAGRNRWLPLQDGNLRFDTEERNPSYTPIANHKLGVHRRGQDGLSFATWAPATDELAVEIFNRDGSLKARHAMEKQPDGTFQLELGQGWSELEGLGYRYATGDIAYSDPRARFLQGQQRGVERVFVDPVLGIETGWYDDSGKGGPNYADNPTWGRFTVDDRPNAEKVQLIIKDENGRQLSKSELLQRLGAPRLLSYEQAPPKDKRDVDILNRWGVDSDAKVTDYQWLERTAENGAIDLEQVGNAWVTTVNNFPGLAGLRYEFRVYENGRLVGDSNGDGQLSKAERVRTPFNDPLSDRISNRPGSERLSLIRESKFQFQHQNAPRKTSDPSRFVIYELHVGSFMGSKDNANPSNFKDLMHNLDYLEELGVNTLELMPFNEFGGKRDWGYTPDYYFAGAEAYGFELDAAEALRKGLVSPREAEGRETVWVHGLEAIKVFVDEAHRRGFNVLGDVVYNHTSGKADADNPMWELDGEHRSFFKWNGQYISNTDWGAKPNFGADGVKQFFVDNAVQQLEELGLDGIRFDFTQVLHDTGTTQEKWEGMQTLRMINRAIDHVRPGAYTVAEDFSRSWLVAADYDRSSWVGENEHRMEKKGMGFDAVWNDRFHDDMIDALAGRASMDRLMEALTRHVDVENWSKAVVYTHSHDEVGNSGQWAARVAAGSQKTEDTLKPLPRALARTAATLTLLAAGVPMLFQGEEFLDNADYKHGVTATWGNDMSWLGHQVDPAQANSLSGDERVAALKRGHFNYYRDLIKLRGSSPAFTSTSEIRPGSVNNAERTLSYVRKGGGEEFCVLANFSDQPRQVPLPEGNWKLVLSSDDRQYGGSGLQGGVAPGSALVYKRV